MSASYLEGQELTVDDKCCKVCTQHNMSSSAEANLAQREMDSEERDDDTTTVAAQYPETERDSIPNKHMTSPNHAVPDMA
eukprot:scaffold30070_cov343-Skeletonema_menzelii.AAC.1